MKINRMIYLLAAVMIGLFGTASTAEACGADEWCCKRDFSAPDNPCIKCCPKNQPGAESLANASGSGHSADTKPQSCKQPLQSSGGSVLLSKADETVQHGTWHPCAEDPDACGSGHVCCAGHCIFGSTCGGN